jgi:hypothetical protein
MSGEINRQGVILEQARSYYGPGFFAHPEKIKHRGVGYENVLLAPSLLGNRDRHAFDQDSWRNRA